MGRGDLTDGQWAVLEPLLLKGTRAGRSPVWSRRRLIDGIRFRVRTGVPWRDVAVEYAPWGRGLRPVPPMAAQRHLAPDTHLAAVPGRRGRCGHMGPERRLHGLPCPWACGRGPQAARPAGGTTGRHLHRAP
ncbi:transposase [Streptomyces sp. MMBL 11-3]|uniref:transposase n=1 Tax=Streptomyces sp. MMBL 11-3 TaxID=3382639 RepID=UPI0039B3D8F0